jgi:hypothetical protein
VQISVHGDRVLIEDGYPDHRENSSGPVPQVEDRP